MAAVVSARPPIAGGGSVSRRWVSETGVSAFLGLSTRTLQAWRLRGQGPPYRKLCGAVRYDMVAVSRWAESQPGGGQAGGAT